MEGTKVTEDKDKSREQLIVELEDLREKLSGAEESRQILEAIMDYAPEAIIITSGTPDFTVRRTSNYAQELTGHPKTVTDGLQAEDYAQTLGLSLPDKPASPELESLPIYRALKDGKVTENEEWVLSRPNGRKVPILCKAAPIRDTSGNIMGGVTVWRDITELKEAEKLEKNYGSYLEYLIMERTTELARAKKNAARVEIELTAILNSASNGVMIFDKDGDLTRINSAAEKALSFTPDEKMLPLEEWLSGLQATTLDGRKCQPEEFPAFRALKGESVIGRKLWVLARSSPQRKCLSFNAAPICGPNRGQVGAVCTFDDITEQQRSLDALRASKVELEFRQRQLGEELEEANRALSSMTARASETRVGYRVRLGRAAKKVVGRFWGSR
ncbi:MAG: PAS domain S-box protein [Syntrophobacter sp.]